MKVGIYSVNSQSGRAYLVDMLNKGYSVFGYARQSTTGQSFIKAINDQQGIYLERPENKYGEDSKFVPLGKNYVGSDLQHIVRHSDVIIIAHPAQYLEDTITKLKKAGISERRVPIILSPPRTFAVPYLWNVLGYNHPFVSFSTCPYSCKAPSVGVSYIKRRKRVWSASLEGKFTQDQVDTIQSLFPQALLNHIPATTSLGNIGAVFHPAVFLHNYESIQQRNSEGEDFSFYLEGIVQNALAAEHIEKIDQVRLKIANYIGVEVFGMKDNPKEKQWAKLMNYLREEESRIIDDIDKVRQVRHDCLMQVSDAVVSAQHWLDYTYGVKRISNETLQDAIGRTTTYHKRSVPQSRYIYEDIPTGIVPLMSIAKKLGIDASPFEEVIALLNQHIPDAKFDCWRDLEEFSKEYIIDYLKGKYFSVK